MWDASSTRSVISVTKSTVGRPEVRERQGCSRYVSTVKVLEFFYCPGPRQGVEDLREVSIDDTAVAQRRLKDKQPEEKTNTDCLVKEQKKEYQTRWKIKTGNILDSCNQRSIQQCMKSGVAKHLGVAEIQQQNGLVDETNVTLFAKVRCFLIQSGLFKVFWAEVSTRSTYPVNRSPSSAIGFKKPIDMLGFFGWLASIKQWMLEPVKVKCIFLGYHKSIVGNKLWRLDGVTSKVVLYKNIGFNESEEYKKTLIGSGVCTCSMQVLHGFEFEVEPLRGHTFEKDGLKDDMDARSDVYVLSNGCKKCSDDSDGYYWGIHQATKGLLDKAKGNVLGMEIVRDRSGYTMRVSQSRFYNGKLNGKWSCIYAVGSHEYQMVCTILDIASADMESLKANLQHIETLSTTEAGYMTFTEPWKKKIWLKGLLTESIYELRLVAGIATGALVKGGSRSEVSTQVEYRNLQIVLSVEDKLPFLEQPIPAMSVPPAGQVLPPDVLNTHFAWVKASREIVGLVLMTMALDIQKNLEQLGAYDMPKELKILYVQQDNPLKDAICHQCGEVGHWRRNRPIYLTELLKKKKLSQRASTSCIFTIEHYSFPSTSWVYDTGCGTHICITTQGLRGSRKLKPRALSPYMVDGHRATVEAIEEFHLCLPSGLVLILHNCHYAPSITRGVISVSRVYKNGFVNRFENDNTISVSRNNLVYFSAIRRDDIYEIDLSSSNTNDSSMYAISNKRAKLNLDSTILWHCRLGHISKKLIEKLQHDGLFNLTDIKSFENVSKGSRNQLGKTIKSLRSDRRGEYMSQEFLDHLKEHEIIAHRTPLYTPQHNGVSERRNRTLLDMVRSLMSQTTLLKSFWDYALESTARILNKVPTKKVEKTPYEVWHGQAPKLSYLKVWGYEALVKRDTLTKPDKLKPRSIKCILVGYPKETMGYSFYYPPENKVFVARNAEFFENSLITQEASGSLEDLKIIQEEDTHPSIDTSLNHREDDQEIDKSQSDINHIRKSNRTRRAPDRMCLHVDAEEHELGDLGEPANYKAALLDPEFDKWLDAMNVEMQSMKDNEAWDLVDLPSNGKTVGSKWIFKKKTDMDGAVHTYKACLVAKGFTQTYGVDYEETFSPVADIRAIRILIAIVSFYDYEIWQ
nr:hypothetical protein [Tanacetum cinerariifolium]